jgi:starch synthase (maltosyl-transferring)
MENRFPIFDLTPRVTYGSKVVPSKAIPGESITVRATVIREGHEKIFAEVVLVDPQGVQATRSPMLEYLPGMDRYEADVIPTSVGYWGFFVEAFNEDRSLISQSETLPIYVERERALVGSWYEFFVRSEGAKIDSTEQIISGTFKTAEQSLKRVAQMGFDVLYLPPIHPIGETFRKGKNNSLPSDPGEPGVPWAIGSSAGGHDTVNPDLGTMADFEEFVAAASALDIEVAMDFALQCSPDHPWLIDHREWFTIRPDGTIAYAENPPKKYQDIYPINMEKDFAGIVNECERILALWISKGIKIFRVDNPHTKPVQFWHELISRINQKYPEVIFLSEAFSRPAMMHGLGKAGFQQAYTYFTWRVTKEELTDYGTELAQVSSPFFRPNFWVNTPDILPYHLQSGQPAVFAMRALLAATMAPSWGMYAGYELIEHDALRPGAEEYLDSEKYEIKVRDWSQPSLAPLITELNRIRRENVALHRLRNIRFHSTNSENILAFSKRDGDNLIIVIVNLDPVNAHDAIIEWDFKELGFTEATFVGEDLFTGRMLDFAPQSEVSFPSVAPAQDLRSLSLGHSIAMVCRVDQ